jgi:predicted permease
VSDSEVACEPCFRHKILVGISKQEIFGALAYKLHPIERTHQRPISGWHSLRYTIRLLLKSPGFAITAVLILGFGIGVNTAIFSLINGVLLKPLPYPKGDRLMRILVQHQNDGWGSLNYPDYLEIRAAQRSFETFAVSHGDVLDLSGDGQAEQLHVGFVSPSVFETSGRPFILGHGFTDNEDIRGGPLVVVLSEKFWRQRFNSDLAVIGKNLTLSDQTFQIIGVCPQQVVDWGPPGTDAYVPVNVLNVFGYELWAREQHLVGCLGRLKDGISTAQAQAELEVVQQRLAVQHPETDADYSIKVIPLLDSEIGIYSTTIWLLGAAVGCLLLISSANVANLLFARVLTRRREIAIRAAMGASRLRLVTQLMFETLESFKHQSCLSRQRGGRPYRNQWTATTANPIRSGNRASGIGFCVGDWNGVAFAKLSAAPERATRFEF